MNDLLDKSQITYRHYRVIAGLPYLIYHTMYKNGMQPISLKGGLTVASYYDPKTCNTYHGIAICSPHDYFERKNGRYVAEQYLIQGIANNRVITSSIKLTNRDARSLMHVARYVGEQSLHNYLYNFCED